MIYVCIIAAANILITTGNTAFLSVAPISALVSSVLGTLFVITLDGVTAFLIRCLPAELFSPSKTLYSAGARERDLYRAIGIKRWKKYIPELGMFTGFHKDKLKSTTDREYLERFILESNYGVAIHLANALCGLGVPILPSCRAPSVWVPIFAVNFVLSLMPAALLRYNTASLIKLYERCILREGPVCQERN
ncbi:MAG: hypothetical protein ACI4QZ_08530 [Eubacteriales bacterium]